MKAILEGTTGEPPSTFDPRGLQAPTSAALHAAATADRLLPLLDLLDPPPQESSQIQQLLDLVEKIAEAQIRVEQKLDWLISRNAARPTGSPKQ
jgi:hypothetical protein